MGVIFQFHYELYNSTFTTKHKDLGVHTVGIGFYISTPPTQTHVNITGNYNFATQYSDTPIIGVPSAGYSDNTYLETLPAYIPNGSIFPCNYDEDNAYYVKLTDTKSGYYAESTGSLGGAPNFKFYDNNGNLLGTYYANGLPISLWYPSYYYGQSNIRAKMGCLLLDSNYTINSPIYCLLAGYNDDTTVVVGSSKQQQTMSAEFKNWLLGLTPYVEHTDPYDAGGTSEPGGGTGNFDLSSDAIAVPSPPTLSAVSAGLVSIYAPTLAQMRALSSYLWNADATTVGWWKKLIANPLDLIIGLSIVPVSVPVESSTVSVKVGLIDTGISMYRASSQYVTVDCGTINVTEFYGAALDYLPFRKTSIYLPFIGTRTLSTDDIMGKSVQVVYNIDLLSGALTAMIKCGDAVLYQYSGSCAMSIPLTGQTFTDMVTSTIQLAAGIGATVASGGTAAGIVAASAANSVMSMKPHIERAGGVSGAAGQLAVMKPYLIGEIPRQSVPEDYNLFAGYPSNIKAALSDLSGYTEIETIYIEGIAATDSELNEIETLLKGGVFL